MENHLVSGIERAAKELELAQREYAATLEAYEAGKADLLTLKAAAGAVTQAHWKLKRAHEGAQR